MDVDGIYIFKADAGTTLYSRRTKNVHEDLFSAFLTALQGFFSDFALGGLSSFTSDNYMIYLASSNNVLTSLIINKEQKSDKYYNLAFEISCQFYTEFKTTIDNPISLTLPNKNQVDSILESVFEEFEKLSEVQQEIVKLYEIDAQGELAIFDYINEEQLYNLSLFVAVNFVTKQIYVIENVEEGVSSRKLFLANKSVTNLNQREFKSQFTIRNVSDPWDFERVVEQVSNLLSKDAIKKLEI